MRNVYISYVICICTLSSIHGIHVYYDDDNVNQFESYPESNFTYSERKRMNRLIDLNDDMPRPCRTDLCDRGEETIERKGTIKLSDTLVGHRLRTLCPYAIYEPVYAERVCRLNYTTWEPYWDQLDTSVCPYPPIAQLADILQAEATSNNTKSLQYNHDMLLRIHSNLQIYSEEPINEQDIESLMPFVLQVIPLYHHHDTLISRPLATAFLSIFDYFMSKYRQSLHDVLQRSQKLHDLAEQLRILPSLITPFNTETYYSEKYANIHLTQQIVLQPMETFKFDAIHESFNGTFSGVHLMLPDLTKGTTIFGTVVVKDMAFFYDDNYREENIALEASFHDTEINFTNQKDTTTLNVDNTNYDMNNIDYSMLYTTKPKFYTESFYGNSSIGTPDLTATEFSLNSVTYPNDDNEYWESPFKKRYEPKGYLQLVSMSRDGHLVNNTDLVVEFEIGCIKPPAINGLITFCPFLDQAFCVKLNEKTNSWSNASCTTRHISWLEVVCTCTGVGEFGSLHMSWGPGTGEQENEIHTMRIDTSYTWDISSFMGFTYRRNLALLGMILNAISLFCLLCTIASYVIIRKARKGRTTSILLNLCAALILLSLALFMAEFMIQSRLGCTIANVIRYYLVFVTLLWNSVEAFHMYIMLVKVFPSTHTSHFMLKAASFAWGVPVLMISLCMIINKKAFNGYFEVVEQYSELDGKCTFKCSLRGNMLYFGYLAPMIVIMIHNLVIFALVFRVILTQGQIAAHKKRSRLIQLAGIAATLVLLGAPWIFSAFGALDVQDNKYLSAFEGTMQVVFVTFINLQGIFIFIFHCARNRKIVESWSSAISHVTRASTRSTSVTSGKHSEKSDSKQANEKNNDDNMSLSKQARTSTEIKCSDIDLKFVKKLEDIG